MNKLALALMFLLLAAPVMAADKPATVTGWSDIAVYNGHIALGSVSYDQSSNSSSGFDLWSYNGNNFTQLVSNAHTQDITAIAWLDNTTIATGSFDGSVKVWQQGSTGWSLSKSFNNTGKVFFMTATGSHGLFYTTTSHQLRQLFLNGTSKIIASNLYSTFDPAWDGSMRLAISNTTQVLIYNLPTMQVTERLNYSSGINDLAWSHDGQWLAIVFGNGNEQAPKLFNPTTNGTERLSSDYVLGRTISWSPNDKLLLLAGYSGNSLVLWNRTSLQRLDIANGFYNAYWISNTQLLTENSVGALTISSLGTIFASYSSSTTAPYPMLGMLALLILVPITKKSSVHKTT